jgi:hypothetical protein
MIVYSTQDYWGFYLVQVRYLKSRKHIVSETGYIYVISSEKKALRWALYNEVTSITKLVTPSHLRMETPSFRNVCLQVLRTPDDCQITRTQ